METSNQNQEMNERFLTLPKELQDLILSPDLLKRLDSIIQPLPIKASQRNAFELEVMLVLMRFADISSFTTNIVHHVQISRDRAEKISKSVTQEIFSPVMNLLTESSRNNQSVSKNVGVGLPAKQKITSDILKNNTDQQLPPRPQQQRIEQRPLVQRPEQNLPGQTTSNRVPIKEPVTQVTQKLTLAHQPSNVFADKLSGSMLMQNEKEKVDVESKNETKSREPDPYRESIE